MSAFQPLNPVENAPTDSRRVAATSSLFKRRRVRVDWRAIAAVDIERVTRNLDVRILQDNVMNVAFCDIEKEEGLSVDPNFVKVFRLAQLIIEYVLHCQKQMESELKVVSQQLETATKAENELKQIVSHREQELVTVKKENRKRRKMLQAAQSLMQAGANGYHKCSLCSKAFISGAFLQSHMQRRHGEQISLTLTDGLMQQKSDRLKHAVDAARETALQTAKADAQSELESAMENMRQQMLTVEENLKAEMKQNEDAMMRKRDVEISEWRAREDRQKVEMDDLHQKISSLERDREEAQKEIDKLKITQANKASHLGELEDDLADGVLKSRQQAEEMERQREEYQQQIGDARTSLEGVQNEMKKREKKWKKRLREMEESHRAELDDMSSKLIGMQRSLVKSTRQAEQLTSSKNDNAEEVNSLKERLEELNQIISEQRNRADVNVTPAKPVTKAQPIDEDETTEEESDEDDGLDVSSFNGSVRKDLADSIKQSRRETETRVESLQTTQAQPLESDDGTETESEKENEVFEANRTLNPGVQTRYRHSDAVISREKKALTSVFGHELERRGVPSSSSRLSSPQYADKLSALEKEREVLAKKHRNVFEIRRSCLKEVNDIVQARFRGDQSVTSAAAAAASKPPITPKPSQVNQPRKQSSQQAPAQPRPYLPQPATKTIVNDWDDDDSDEETESDLESLPDGIKRRETIEPIKSIPSVTEPPPPPPRSSTPNDQRRKNADNSWDSEESQSGLSESVEEDDDLDLPGISHAVKAEPTIPASSLPRRMDDDDDEDDDDDGDDDDDKRIEVKRREGSGRVASLTHRLSASLSMSPDPSKKPKGGVALFGGSALPAAAPAKMANDFDDDDDDEFSSVTEMDDDVSESKRNTGGMKFTSASSGSRMPVMVPSIINNDFSDLDDDDIETTALPH
ncbi:cilium assembly protein DZIP1L-like isoform X2 [Oscarella lobularis]|uniref:cilium assembly protein DZIP1L-like isoform X2 n=1 Tax=Oscarella lobularis TaxID=121494 RepID=UPI0033134BE7